MRALILYASNEDQTDRIGQRISGCIAEHGIPNDVVNVVVQQPADEIVIDAYDAVILGSSVHKGHYESAIRSCIQEYRTFLSEVPTAFFSVSLGNVGKHANDRGEARGLADDFLHELRWEPSTKVNFAGSLRYSRYGWPKQKLMHWIGNESVTETDVHRDHEHMDWDAVENFAAQFAHFVHCCKQPKPVRRTFYFSIRRTRPYSVRSPMASVHG